MTVVKPVTFGVTVVIAPWQESESPLLRLLFSRSRARGSSAAAVGKGTSARGVSRQGTRFMGVLKTFQQQLASLLKLTSSAECSFVRW